MPQGLGRGLSSLIPKKTFNTSAAVDQLETVSEPVVLKDGDRVLYISPEQIALNPQQPRLHFQAKALEELTASIKEHGIIQPLIVTKKGGAYELIAGERRLRSAKSLGLAEVPVIVRQEQEQKKLELALIENLQRENLNPMESARAYRRLIDEFNITQEEAAQRLGKARSSLTNSLRLLSLPVEAQEALAEGKISEAHAKYLLGLDNENKQLAVLKKILRQGLTVAQTDQTIKSLGGTKSARPKDYVDRAREEELGSYLGTKVEIKRRRQGGQVVLEFYGEEELGAIIKKIKGV